MYQFSQGENEDVVAKAQREIDSVRGIMTENIERVLERGERIDLLVDKTAGLQTGAREFRVRSRGLRRRMWWKNTKLMILLVFVCVFLLYLFVGFGCGLPGKICPLSSLLLLDGCKANVPSRLESVHWLREMRYT